MKLPHIKLVNPFKPNRPTGTGSGATALNMRQHVSPGQAQGSGSLQASEAISYGPVPLAYIHHTVPKKENVGKPLHQHSGFIPATTQRKTPATRAVVPTGSHAPVTGKHGGR